MNYYLCVCIFSGHAFIVTIVDWCSYVFGYKEIHADPLVFLLQDAQAAWLDVLFRKFCATMSRKAYENINGHIPRNTICWKFLLPCFSLWRRTWNNGKRYIIPSHRKKSCVFCCFHRKLISLLTCYDVCAGTKCVCMCVFEKKSIWIRCFDANIFLHQKRIVCDMKRNTSYIQV